MRSGGERRRAWWRAAWPPLLVFGVVAWGASGYIRRLPDGLFDRGDPLLTSWILAWDQRQVLRDPLRLFDANIFHPFPRTLAYSEHIFGPAMLALPARLFTDNAIAVQNVSYLTSFLALGLAGYLLFFWASGSRMAAACGAVLLALAPVRFTALGHVQILHTAGLPLALYGMARFVEERRRSAAAIVFAGLLFSALTSFYLAVMAAVTVLLFFAASPLAVGWRRTAGAARGLLPWLAAATALALPFAIPYWRLRTQFSFVRPLEANWENWASHKFYVRPFPGSVAARVGGTFGLSPGGSIYLGVLVLLLAALGATLAWRRRRESADAGRARALSLFFQVLAIFAAFVSFGGWRTLAGARIHLPFYWLHRLPVFDGIRAPVRFSVLVDLAIVALAVLGLATVGSFVRRRWGAGISAALVAGMGALAFVERTPPLPIRLLETVEVGREVPHVYAWLARQGFEQRILELPMETGRMEREPWDALPYKQVHFSTRHWSRTVNGTSGYFPPGYEVVLRLMSGFPSAESFAALRCLPIDRVVVHRQLIVAPVAAARLEAEGFRVLHACEADFVIAVPPAAADTPRLRPTLRLVSRSPDGARAVVKLGWEGTAPPLLYPGLPYGLTLRATDAAGAKYVWRQPRRLFEPASTLLLLVRARRPLQNLELEAGDEDGDSARVAWTAAPRAADRAGPRGAILDTGVPQDDVAP